MLERVVEGCGRFGVDVLPVKGVVTAGLLYADPAERSFQDVDLRVRPTDLRRVERAAAIAGWPLVSRSRAYGTLAFDVLGFLVEFESHVGPPGLCALSVTEMMGRASCRETSSRAVLLEPEIHDHGLVLCVNAFKDKLIDAVPGAIRDLEVLPALDSFHPEKFAELAVRVGAVTIVRIVARWLLRARRARRWETIHDRLGPSDSRPRYAAAFERAIWAPSPQRPFLRVLARLGADRRSEQSRAVRAMVARAVEEKLVSRRGANTRASRSTQISALGPPPTGRACSPR